MTKSTIPSYGNPPVIEVAWSVQFATLPWLTAAHTGLFWSKIRDAYPACEEQPPIERAEEPEVLLQPRRIVPQMQMLLKPPPCRQWFIAAAGNDLVQLQADRFCVNWRKVNPGDKYPRYGYQGY